MSNPITPTETPVTQPAVKRTNWLARVAFVAAALGIIGVFTATPWLAIVGALIGITSGITGVRRARAGASSMGFAVLGIVLGGIVTLFLIVLYLAYALSS